MATESQLYALQRLWAEVWRAVEEGRLDVEYVHATIQSVLDGAPSIEQLAKQLLGGLPHWYVSPESQLEQLRQLNEERNWGFVELDFPPIPDHFTQRTETEVLMLACYLPSGLQQTFDELWEIFTPPEGYVKTRKAQFASESESLRTAANWRYYAGIEWVMFDYAAYRAESPDEALQQAEDEGLRLAGVEVLAAAILFPGWMVSWGGVYPHPKLSGLRLAWNDSWIVPHLTRRQYPCDRVELNANLADQRHERSASPTVRWCR